MTKTYDNAIRTGKEFLGQVVTNVTTDIDGDIGVVVFR